MQGSYGVVRSIDELHEMEHDSKDLATRYLMKEEELLTAFPIPIDEEKRVMAIFYKGDHPYSHAKSKRYPIIGEIDSKNKSM